MSGNTPGRTTVEDEDEASTTHATTTSVASPVADQRSLHARQAHRHHHAPGHSARHTNVSGAAGARGPPTPTRRHRHHHHHHNECADRPPTGGEQGDGEWRDDNDEDARVLPQTATFGTYATEQRRQGDDDGGHAAAPRTAPLQQRAASSDLLQPGPPSRQLTPAPSYHTDDTDDSSSTATIRAAVLQRHDGLTSSRLRHIIDSASSDTFGAPVATHVTLPLRAASPGMMAASSPHVHFMRSRSGTTDSTSAASTEGAPPDRPTRSPRRVSYVQSGGQSHSRASQHESMASINALQARDRRFSAMVNDVYDPSRASAGEQALRKRASGGTTSMTDDILGFGQMTPADLISAEGAKIDGGFGFALPQGSRESTVLLDSRQERRTTSSMSSSRDSSTSYASSQPRSRFSTDSISSLASSLSSVFMRRGGNNNGNGTQRQAGATTATRSSGGMLQRDATPATLSNRVNSANLRPSQLDLNRTGARGGGNGTGHAVSRPSRLRESTTDSSDYRDSQTSATSTTWEDVQLNSAGGGKNDRIADALGVRRSRQYALRHDDSTTSDLTVINEEDSSYTESGDKTDDGYNEKRGFDRDATRNTMGSFAYANEGETHPRNPRFVSGASDSDGYRTTMNLPPGLSQADIVAICLVQGMVPPGLPPDPTLVTWSGPLSPSNPRNWSPGVKWYACILVSWSTFLANAATNMIAPALGLMSSTYRELYIMALRGSLIGAYIFAFTFAPLLFGPMSEIMGRKPVLIIGSTLFFVASLLSGFVTAVWQLLLLRFLAALGASAPMSIGGAVLTDIFSPDQRGRAMTLFALAPQLGPVLGPIMGGWVTQEVRNWRWIFWISAICAFTAAVPMLFIRESYSPRILADRAAKMRKQTGNEQLSTIFERRRETKRQILTRGVVRPMILFWCEPLVQLLTLYVSLIYGIIHLMVATFPAVFGTIYAEYPGWASMHFICIGIGTITGGFAGGYLVERHDHALTVANRGVSKPEFKFYCMLYTVWIPPLGLMIYGVVTYFGIHWIFADLGIVVFCFGISVAVVAIQSYTVSAYALLAGSALTATIVFRSIVGTGATIGSEDLLLHAGMLWSNVALSLALVLIGAPAAYIIYIRGESMRMKSRHATHKR